VPIDASVEAALQKVYKQPVAQLDERYTCDSVRDAPVRDGRYSLIVFSHGNGGNRHQNTFWCDHLASHGYIIVSADHTGNCSFCIIDGVVIPYAKEQRKQSTEDRPKDMSFLLDQMIRWDRGADSRFAGKIDTDHAAATGMSFGAFTSVQVIEQDPRFKAIIPMSGAWARSHKYHGENTGPSYLLEFILGGHYTFTDMFKINPKFGDGVGQGQRADGASFDYTSMERSYEIVNAYSTAFCGLYLKGETGYQGYLAKNHWKDEVKWDARGVK
jgi:dienelactone hydrolase